MARLQKSIDRPEFSMAIQFHKSWLPEITNFIRNISPWHPLKFEPWATGQPVDLLELPAPPPIFDMAAHDALTPSAAAAYRQAFSLAHDSHNRQQTLLEKEQKAICDVRTEIRRTLPAWLIEDLAPNNTLSHLQPHEIMADLRARYSCIPATDIIPLRNSLDRSYQGDINLHIATFNSTMQLLTTLQHGEGALQQVDTFLNTFLSGPYADHFKQPVTVYNQTHPYCTSNDFLDLPDDMTRSIASAQIAMRHASYSQPSAHNTTHAAYLASSLTLTGTTKEIKQMAAHLPATNQGITRQPHLETAVPRGKSPPPPSRARTPPRSRKPFVEYRKMCHSCGPNYDHSSATCPSRKDGHDDRTTYKSAQLPGYTGAPYFPIPNHKK